MTFSLTLHTLFPNAIPEPVFVRDSIEALAPYGFSRETAIACVGVCRDEIAQPFTRLVEQSWGEAFVFSSLAGMLFLGVTGFKAAEQHAPINQGRERYVFYALPHIAIGPSGEIGLCYRGGRKDPSTACGALAAFQDEVASGSLHTSLDPDDLEYSLIKQRLLPSIGRGEKPGLLDLTHLAYQAVRADLQRLVTMTVDPTRADYALFTGIQVHGPDQSYVWPGERLVVVGGKRQE
jgi:hypothetical protein